MAAEISIQWMDDHHWLSGFSVADYQVHIPFLPTYPHPLSRPLLHSLWLLWGLPFPYPSSTPFPKLPAFLLPQPKLLVLQSSWLVQGIIGSFELNSVLLIYQQLADLLQVSYQSRATCIVKRSSLLIQINLCIEVAEQIKRKTFFVG